MNTIKDGDSAFPRPVSWSEEGGTHRGTLGMTLRDYFAGQALAGLLTRSHAHDWTQRAIIDNCYSCADAMIKAREAKP